MKNKSAFLLGLAISVLCIVFVFYAKIQPKILVEYEWPYIDTRKISHLDFLRSYSYQSEDGRIIDIVNRSKRVFTIEFESTNSLEVKRINYYYEKSGKLYMQKYNVNNYIMDYQGTVHVPQTKLKGRNF